MSVPKLAWSQCPDQTCYKLLYNCKTATEVVDLPLPLQQVVVVPPMEAPHVSSLATLSDKHVLEPAGPESGSGSVVEL